MDDKDVRRIEDRIEASNREFQLRLDVSNERAEARLELALSKIDGTFGAMSTAMAGIRSDIGGMKSELAEGRSITRTWGQWIIATVFVVGLGLAGLLVGVKQIWTAGVQSGQTIQAAPPSSQK